MMRPYQKNILASLVSLAMFNSASFADGDEVSDDIVGQLKSVDDEILLWQKIGVLENTKKLALTDRLERNEIQKMMNAEKEEESKPLYARINEGETVTDEQEIDSEKLDANQVELLAAHATEQGAKEQTDLDRRFATLEKDQERLFDRVKRFVSDSLSSFQPLIGSKGEQNPVIPSSAYVHSGYLETVTSFEKKVVSDKERKELKKLFGDKAKFTTDPETGETLFELSTGHDSGDITSVKNLTEEQKHLIAKIQPEGMKFEYDPETQTYEMKLKGDATVSTNKVSAEEARKIQELLGEDAVTLETQADGTVVVSIKGNGSTSVANLSDEQKALVKKVTGISGKLSETSSGSIISVKKPDVVEYKVKQRMTADELSKVKSTLPNNAVIKENSDGTFTVEYKVKKKAEKTVSKIVTKSELEDLKTTLPSNASVVKNQDGTYTVKYKEAAKGDKITLDKLSEQEVAKLKKTLPKDAKFTQNSDGTYSVEYESPEGVAIEKDAFGNDIVVVRDRLGNKVNFNDSGIAIEETGEVSRIKVTSSATGKSKPVTLITKSGETVTKETYGDKEVFRNTKGEIVAIKSGGIVVDAQGRAIESSSEFHADTLTVVSNPNETGSTQVSLTDANGKSVTKFVSRDGKEVYKDSKGRVIAIKENGITTTASGDVISSVEEVTGKLRTSTQQEASTSSKQSSEVLRSKNGAVVIKTVSESGNIIYKTPDGEVVGIEDSEGNLIDSNGQPMGTPNHFKDFETAVTSYAGEDIHVTRDGQVLTATSTSQGETVFRDEQGNVVAIKDKNGNYRDSSGEFLESNSPYLMMEEVEVDSNLRKEARHVTAQAQSSGSSTSTKISITAGEWGGDDEWSDESPYKYGAKIKMMTPKTIEIIIHTHDTKYDEDAFDIIGFTPSDKEAFFLNGIADMVKVKIIEVGKDYVDLEIEGQKVRAKA